jgi:hypothetical protein
VEGEGDAIYKRDEAAVGQRLVALDGRRMVGTLGGTGADEVRQRGEIARREHFGTCDYFLSAEVDVQLRLRCKSNIAARYSFY